MDKSKKIIYISIITIIIVLAIITWIYYSGIFNNDSINNSNVEKKQQIKTNNELDKELNEATIKKELTEEEKKEKEKIDNFDNVINDIKRYANEKNKYTFKDLKKLPFIKEIKDTEDWKIIVLQHWIEIKEDDIGYYDMYGVWYINWLFIVKTPESEIKAKKWNIRKDIFTQWEYDLDHIYRIIPYLESDEKWIVDLESYVEVEFLDWTKEKYYLNELKLAWFKYDPNVNKIFKEKIVSDWKIHRVNQEYIIFKDKSWKVYKELIKKEFKEGKNFLKINPLKLVKYDDNYFILEFDFPVDNLFIVNKKRKKAYKINDYFEQWDKVKINIKLLAKILNIKNKDKIEFFSAGLKQEMFDKYGIDILKRKWKYILNIWN